MGAYNIHKRHTLDRLTAKYNLRAREVVRRHAEAHAAEMIRALNSDARIFLPPTAKLRDALGRVYEEHQENVIEVAVSDGIQEVSPEKELNLWMLHPLYTPIEDTLSVALAKKRDKIVNIQSKKLGKQFKKRLEKLLDTHVDDYLGNLQKAYKKLASDWLDGESTIRETTDAIREALKATDYQAQRIFRTETTSYFNRSRHDYFSENTAVDYMQIFAVTDGRISNICEDRHRFVITIAQAALKKYMPPFHPHCRSIQRPLISALATHKAMIEAGLKMNERRFTPLASGWG